jgi:hypothetical protein
MKITQRITNMAHWGLFMLESLVFVIVPSDMALPYCTHYLMDTSSVKMSKLTSREREAIWYYVITAGFAAISAFLGLGFGVFGKYSPSDVFGQDGDTPINLILEKRRKNKCCICLERFKYDEGIHKLQCGHCFHGHCMDQWRKRSKTCPLCRQ